MTIPEIVDSHCHLDVDKFSEDVDEIVARAGRAGVGRMITICTKVSEFERVLSIAERYDNIWCSLGIHPHHAGTEDAVSVERLIELSRHPKVVGIGETGLDFFYDKAPRDIQEAYFRTHIEAARETGLPLIVHTRDAEADTARILEEEYARGPFTGELHCFTSSQELAECAVRLGMMIAFSGIVTFKNAEDLRETAKALPLESRLVETDSPFCAPVPMRGKRCEPAFVVHTATALAELRGIPLSEFAAATTENFERLFPKVSATQNSREGALA